MTTSIFQQQRHALQCLETCMQTIKALADGAQKELEQSQQRFASQTTLRLQLDEHIVKEEVRLHALKSEVSKHAAKLQILGSNLTLQSVQEMVATYKKMQEFGGLEEVKKRLSKRKRATEPSGGGRRAKDHREMLTSLGLKLNCAYVMSWDGGAKSIVRVRGDRVSSMAADEVALNLAVSLSDRLPWKRYACVHGAVAAANLEEIVENNAKELMRQVMDPSNIRLLYDVDAEDFKRTRGEDMSTKDAYMLLVRDQTIAFLQETETFCTSWLNPSGSGGASSSSAGNADVEDDCVLLGEQTLQARNERGFANAIVIE